MRTTLSELKRLIAEIYQELPPEEKKRYIDMVKEQLQGLISDIKDVINEKAPDAKVLSDWKILDWSLQAWKSNDVGTAVNGEAQAMYDATAVPENAKPLVVAISKSLGGKFKVHKTGRSFAYSIEADEVLVWVKYNQPAAGEMVFNLSVGTSKISPSKRAKWEMERSQYRMPPPKLMQQYYFAHNKAGYGQKFDVYDLAWWLGDPAQNSSKMPDAIRKRLYDETGWQTVTNREELEDLQKALPEDLSWLWHELSSAALVLWQ